MKSEQYLQFGELQQDRRDFVDPWTHTDSDREIYEESLGVDFRELHDKKVLDIGGEPGGYIAQEAKRQNIDMVNFNPSVQHVSFTDRNMQESIPTVQGLVQSLPFENKTFDIELAFASVPAYLPKFDSEYKTAFSEMLRVLKYNGKILIYPILQSLRDS